MYFFINLYHEQFKAENVSTKKVKSEFTTQTSIYKTLHDKFFNLQGTVEVKMLITGQNKPSIFSLEKPPVRP